MIGHNGLVDEITTADSEFDPHHVSSAPSEALSLIPDGSVQTGTVSGCSDVNYLYNKVTM